jgi:DNA replication protein DnaC
MSEPRTLAELLAECRKRFAQGSANESPPSGGSPERQKHPLENPPENPTIPKSFRWATLGAPELRQRVARVQAIAEGEAALSSGGLLLVGPSGSGKTALACALLRAWEARNPRRRGMFAAAWRLGVARAEYGLGQGEPPEVERAMAVALLVLDDIGSDRNAPTSAVTDVIFARANAGIPTWGTTWMNPQAVAQRYGDGIARRLYESGRVTIIACGKDS